MSERGVTAPARVAIILPLFDDEEWIAKALESCLAQTLAEIEVICVDDASTDATVTIIEGFQQRDPRIRLIRQERNGSAFQARRAGVLAARAPYVLFLDGDDELAPRAAELALEAATTSGADLVGFGVKVLLDKGRVFTDYQSRLAPKHASLRGPEVLRELFPVGQAAQGQLWRYLFATHLLRQAYDALPHDLVLRRVNDLPITFLAVAGAQHYVSVQQRLYRYYFRRGGSGHRVKDLAQFEFYCGAIDSVDAVAAALDHFEGITSDPAQLRASFESARIAIIGNVLNYVQASVGGDLQGACLALLHAKASPSDVVTAAVRHFPGALRLLAEHGRRVELGERPVQSVVLTTKSLRTGGVSAVIRSQAHFLREAGCQVTIVATGQDSDSEGLPEGVNFVEVTGRLPDRVAQWSEICRAHAVDVIIDHQILYSRQWPSYALAARALGVPTIGWIHNFSMRPVYNGGDLLTFMARHFRALATVVTLSPLDVAFWKLRGIEHTAYLPNPPSPLLLESTTTATPRRAPSGPIRLVWWGRLEEHTKGVSQLIEVADHLRRQSADFKLTIIGPEWAGLTPDGLAEMVRERKLDGFVDVVGPRYGEELIASLDDADLFLSTSIIEGYQLTLAEGQARGLPVAMYDLPWLTLVQENDGIISVPQGDAAGLARAIIELCDDPERYEWMSAASIEAARQATTFDFASLYRQLVAGKLPDEYSPEPTLADAGQLLELMGFFAARAAARLAEAANAVPPAEPPAPASVARRAARRVVRRYPALAPVARRVARRR